MGKAGEMRPQYAEQIPRLQAAIDYWLPLMDLGHIEIRFNFVPTVREDDENCAADTHGKWQYRGAQINFYLPNICVATDEFIDNYVVHELVHVLCDPMESLMEESQTDQCELAVENVCRAILKAGNRDR